MIQTEFIILLLAVAAILVLQLVILLRARAGGPGPQLDQLQSALERHQQQAGERTERELRGEVQLSAQATRQELGANLLQFQQALMAQLTSVAGLQNSQI